MIGASDDIRALVGMGAYVEHSLRRFVPGAIRPPTRRS